MLWKMDTVSEPNRLVSILLKGVKQSKILVLYSTRVPPHQGSRLWMSLVFFVVFPMSCSIQRLCQLFCQPGG